MEARGGRLTHEPALARASIESFNYAFEGIIHVLRTQRNMRIHFAVAVAVLVGAVAVGVSKIELIALLLAIAFVLVAEMINTAIEGAIDVATTLVRPDGEAREGHRRRRRADRGDQRGRGRLSRLLRQGRRQTAARCSTGSATRRPS